MDQNYLVAEGHRLLTRLDDAGLRSEAAIWMRDPEADQWRLWIVPRAEPVDRFEFYRQVAKCISAEPPIDLAGSSVQMTPRNHPAIVALGQRADAVRNHRPLFLSTTMLNGFFVSEAIVLRLEPTERSHAA